LCVGVSGKFENHQTLVGKKNEMNEKIMNRKKKKRKKFKKPKLTIKVTLV
jgi:hypothetical protein